MAVAEGPATEETMPEGVAVLLAEIIPPLP